MFGLIDGFKGMYELYKIERTINHDKTFIYAIYRTMAVATSMILSLVTVPKSNTLINDKITVPYYTHGHRYIALLNNSHGPQPAIDISHGDENITDQMLEYMGPNLDFHGMEVTPSFFGYGTIKITVMDICGDNSEYTFEKNDVIKGFK
jgi:hypothetical protein